MCLPNNKNQNRKALLLTQTKAWVDDFTFDKWASESFNYYIKNEDASNLLILDEYGSHLRRAEIDIIEDEEFDFIEFIPSYCTRLV